jgi:hypothetical protein
MRRAGREHAEDVKRRIVAACQEVGLTIKSAKMYLCDDDTRIIFVYAFTPDDQNPSPAIEIMTSVHVGGSWSGTVEMKCAAGKTVTCGRCPSCVGVMRFL